MPPSAQSRVTHCRFSSENFLCSTASIDGLKVSRLRGFESCSFCNFLDAAKVEELEAELQTEKSRTTELEAAIQTEKSRTRNLEAAIQALKDDGKQLIVIAKRGRTNKLSDGHLSQ